MATTTPNFGWPVPTSTDLVKDGATAIEALGDGIDASLVDLKGGTTGQVLSKTTGADMDFTWVTTDDANAIQNSIVNAKGDIIGASANDVPAITSAGANGTNLVADSSTTTGLSWQGDYAAGKNKIINSDFRIAQRGTSFSNPTGGLYTLDRWFYTAVGANPIAMTISQQTFTPGTAPVAGYEGANFIRMDLTTIGVGQTRSDITSRLEDCRLFAGQTATLSFWAKSDSNRTNTMRVQRNFGSGGSSAETIVNPVSFATTTAWTRFTFTFSISSISGKTIGTSSFIELFIGQAVASGCVLDIWGVQLEAGSVATAFQTATGTIQGELAACKRYLPSVSPADAIGYAYGTNLALYHLPFDVEARVAPTGVTLIGTYQAYALNVGSTITPAFNLGKVSGASVTAGLTITAGQGSRLQAQGTATILFTGCEL